MQTISINGHTIRVRTLPSEVIFESGQEVSRKVTFFGATHLYRVEEDGEIVEYEIKTWFSFLRTYIQISRNGVVVYDQ